MIFNRINLVISFIVIVSIIYRFINEGVNSFSIINKPIFIGILTILILSFIISLYTEIIDRKRNK